MTKKLFICATVLLLNTNYNFATPWGPAQPSKKQLLLQREAATARGVIVAAAATQQPIVTLPPAPQDNIVMDTTPTSSNPLVSAQTQEAPIEENVLVETAAPDQSAAEKTKPVFSVESGYLSDDETEGATAQASRSFIGRVFANKYANLTSGNYTVEKGQEQLAVRDFNRVLQEELLAVLKKVDKATITDKTSKHDLFYIRETLEANFNALMQCQNLLDKADDNSVKLSPVLLKTVKDQMAAHTNTMRHIQSTQQENNVKQSFNSNQMLRKKHPAKVAVFIKELAANKEVLSETEVDKAGRLVNRTLETILSSCNKEGLEDLLGLIEANNNQFQISDTKKVKIDEYLTTMKKEIQDEDKAFSQELDDQRAKVIGIQNILNA